MSLASIEALTGTPALDTDVCIVGAGPAGIALALRLDALQIRSVVLESGRADDDSDTQALYRTDTDGIPYSGELTRRRRFGGSSNCWAGWCRPLDPQDFTARAHIPHSGWPFDFAEYLEYLDAASTLCELGEPRFDLGYWRSRLEKPWDEQPDIVDEQLRSGVFQHSPPTRFASRYRAELERSSHSVVVLGANVTRAHLAGRQAVHLIARNLQGAQLEVRARYFVLACGGIENARLLLSLNGTDRPALGNEYDQVGRHFTDHLIFHRQLDVFPTGSAIKAYVDMLPTQHPDRPHAVTPWLGMTTRIQEAERLSNTTLRFDRPQPLSDDEVDTRTVWNGLASSQQRESDGSSIPERMTAVFISEILPNPDSRVTLAEESDALGMPRARITWRISPADIDSIRRSAERIGRTLWRLGLARPGPVRVPDPDTLDNRSFWIGNHHYGTTRMSDDPRHGVVDKNGRVHSLDNLYVTGRSIFPTTGAATPTLSIVMLALRLANHLEQRFNVEH